MRLGPKFAPRRQRVHPAFAPPEFREPVEHARKRRDFAADDVALARFSAFKRRQVGRGDVFRHHPAHGRINHRVDFAPHERQEERVVARWAKRAWAIGVDHVHDPRIETLAACREHLALRLAFRDGVDVRQGSRVRARLADQPGGLDDGSGAARVDKPPHLRPRRRPQERARPAHVDPARILGRHPQRSGEVDDAVTASHHLHQCVLVEQIAGDLLDGRRQDGRFRRRAHGRPHAVAGRKRRFDQHRAQVPRSSGHEQAHRTHLLAEFSAVTRTM